MIALDVKHVGTVIPFTSLEYASKLASELGEGHEVASVLNKTIVGWVVLGPKLGAARKVLGLRRGLGRTTSHHWYRSAEQ